MINTSILKNIYIINTNVILLLIKTSDESKVNMYLMWLIVQFCLFYLFNNCSIFHVLPSVSSCKIHAIINLIVDFFYDYYFFYWSLFKYNLQRYLKI